MIPTRGLSKIFMIGIAVTQGVLLGRDLTACVLLAPQDDAASDEVTEELEFATTLFEEGTYFKAADILREVVAENPGLVEARVLLMQVELAQGNIEEAEALDGALAELGPEAPPAVLLARADHAFARGNVDLARELGEMVRADDQTNLRAAHIVARSLEYRGREEEARKVVSDATGAVDLNSLDSDGLLDAGRLFYTVGDWDFAAECGVHAERRRKKENRATTDILVFLGDLYRLALSMKGTVPRAFDPYRDALKINNSLVPAKVGRALVHLYVYDLVKAEVEVDEALAINPNSVDALSVKAWFRVLDGQYTEALRLLGRALETNPSSKRARSTRAAALYLLNRHEDHEVEMSAIAELDPTYGGAHHLVGDALSHHMRYAQAIVFHQQALEMDPGLGLAQISLGRDLCLSAREDEGLAALTESYEGHPYPHPWRNNMEMVLKKLDREFIDSSTEHFRLRVHADENPVLGPRLQEALEEDYAHLLEKYGESPDDSVLVEMMPLHQDFSVRTVGFSGLGAVGACFGDFVTLVSPRSELRGSFCWRRTVLHELAHVFTISRSDARVPRWLTEGLSVYEERVARTTWGRDQDSDLLNAYYSDNLIPMRDFNSQFRGPRIGFAYFQGGLWAEYAVSRFGFEKILDLLDAYAEDLETEAAIQQVFGMGLEEMDRDFARYVFETRLKDVRVQPIFGRKKRASMRQELRKEGDNPDLLADTAWAYYQAGKVVDADSFLDRSLKIEPTLGKSLRLAAFRSIDRKRSDLAMQYLNTAFENGDVEYRAALLLAKLRSDDEDYSGAIDALIIARDCFPAGVGPGNPYLQLHQIYASEGQSDKAIEALADFVDRAEVAMKPRVDLATMLEHQGRNEEALQYLLEAEDIDPFVRSVYVAQGRNMRSLGRWAEAVGALRSALHVDPSLEPGYTPAPPGGSDDQANREEKATILIEIASIELEAGDERAAERDLGEARRLWFDVPIPDDLQEKIDSE